MPHHCNLKLKFLFLLILHFYGEILLGQDTSKISFNLPFGYGYQIPISSINERYGSNAFLHTAVLFKTKGLEIGPSIYYHFGNTVKEDILAGLRTPEGNLIGIDHAIADVTLRMRGIKLGIEVQKPILLPNKHQIILGISPSWLSHWIRFQNPGNTFEPIQGRYAYGYDRLSSGLGISESISYRYISKSKLIHLEFSLCGTQAFTKIKRSTQFDKPNIQDNNQTDIWLGSQIKWILPFYSRKNPDTIYY